MRARARSIATGEAWNDRVTIVGAGPAGLACAIALARGGRRVVVREWHQHVGDRFHDDFQGLENRSDERDVLDELAACGIEPSFAHHPVHEGTAFDAKGRTHHLKSRRPLYYLVLRGRGRAGGLRSGRHFADLHRTAHRKKIKSTAAIRASCLGRVR